MFEGAIRVPRESDAQGVAAIYAPIVRDTVISFEVEPPTREEMARRIAATLATHPWLVAERDGQVIGYAYASRHNERAAYRWSVDVTVYISTQAQRGGVGRALYQKLFDILRRQGFHAAFARIVLPNEPSVGLHEAIGFQPAGVLKEVGYKHGQWCDTGWWRLELSDASGEPAEPIAFAALPAITP
jgi:phosphinothricin acetyltransferase